MFSTLSKMGKCFHCGWQTIHGFHLGSEILYSCKDRTCKEYVLKHIREGRNE